MNIEDLTQAVEQAAQVHKFLYKHRIEFADMLGSDAYQVWYRLDLKLIEMEKAQPVEADDLSRITAQIVAESARQNVVMAAALMRMDRIMAEYHDDIEEAKRNERNV